MGRKSKGLVLDMFKPERLQLKGEEMGKEAREFFDINELDQDNYMYQVSDLRDIDEGFWRGMFRKTVEKLGFKKAAKKYLLPEYHYLFFRKALYRDSDHFDYLQEQVISLDSYLPGKSELVGVEEGVKARKFFGMNEKDGDGYEYRITSERPSIAVSFWMGFFGPSMENIDDFFEKYSVDEVHMVRLLHAAENIRDEYSGEREARWYGYYLSELID